MVSEHRVSAPASSRRGAVAIAACLVIGAMLASMEAVRGEAAPHAQGLLGQLETGAGVPASEQNAEDLAVLARFYQERQMRPLWIGERSATERAGTLAGSSRPRTRTASTPTTTAPGRSAVSSTPRVPTISQSWSSG
jgi:hypothetical protein